MGGVQQRRREKENMSVSSPARRAQLVRSLEVPPSPRLKLYDVKARDSTVAGQRSGRGENRAPAPLPGRERSREEKRVDKSCERLEERRPSETLSLPLPPTPSARRAADTPARGHDFAVPRTPKVRPVTYGASPTPAVKLFMDTDVRTPEFRSESHQWCL